MFTILLCFLHYLGYSHMVCIPLSCYRCLPYYVDPCIISLAISVCLAHCFVHYISTCVILSCLFITLFTTVCSYCLLYRIVHSMVLYVAPCITCCWSISSVIVLFCSVNCVVDVLILLSHAHYLMLVGPLFCITFCRWCIMLLIALCFVLHYVDHHIR